MEAGQELLTRLVFGRRNPSVPYSLHRALELGLVPPRHVAEALAIVNSYPYPRKPRWALPARSAYNDPGWDNVIRALEEDR